MEISDISFAEGSEFLLSIVKANPELIISSVYSEPSEALTTINIKSLHKVIIKAPNPLENDLGKASIDDHDGIIHSSLILGYTTVVNLTKDTKFFTEDKYKNALATVWHELYHIYDREVMIKKDWDQKRSQFFTS